MLLKRLSFPRFLFLRRFVDCRPQALLLLHLTLNVLASGVCERTPFSSQALRSRKAKATLAFNLSCLRLPATLHLRASELTSPSCFARPWS